MAHGETSLLRLLVIMCLLLLLLLLLLNGLAIQIVSHLLRAATLGYLIELGKLLTMALGRLLTVLLLLLLCLLRLRV